METCGRYCDAIHEVHLLLKENAQLQERIRKLQEELDYYKNA